MLTTEEWDALAGTLDPVNGEIVHRANTYYYFPPSWQESFLETSHNLVRDAINNLVVALLPVPQELLDLEEDLYNQRLDLYGAIGRPAGDMTAPYWRP